MSVVDLLVVIGYPVALFAIAFRVETRLRQREPLFSVSAVTRTLLGGLALGGPWSLYWGEYLPGLGDPLAVFVPLTLSFVLWIGADRLVGVIDRDRGQAC